MNYDITKLLDVIDEDVIIENMETDAQNRIRIIYMSKAYHITYCPLCGSKMHSHGFYQRTINHPIFQDGYQLLLKCSLRKWHCNDPLCNHYLREQFSFTQKGKQSTSLVPLLVGDMMKNIELTTDEIAKRLYLSDSQCREIFMRYCQCERLKLSKVISIDEVYLNFDSKHKYALIIMDFLTSQIIDILPSRRERETNKYFINIPLEERDNVEVLICDMYNPYIGYTRRYFRNAKCVIDSFHVCQWLIQRLRGYILSVKRRYQKRDEKLREDSNEKTNRFFKTSKTSKEVYLLSNYSWVLLKDESHINYSTEKRRNSFLNQYLDSYDYEKMFLALDENFVRYRQLKELYIRFNGDCASERSVKEKQFDELIEIYRNSQDELFIEFADLLECHRTEVLNSFEQVYVTKGNNKDALLRRLSNGPMESFNNIPKDLKRNSHGVSNFDYTRLRILWATRNHTAIRAVPLKREQVKYPTNKKRGKYKKK